MYGSLSPVEPSHGIERRQRREHQTTKTHIRYFIGFVDVRSTTRGIFGIYFYVSFDTISVKWRWRLMAELWLVEVW